LGFQSSVNPPLLQTVSAQILALIFKARNNSIQIAFNPGD
jgi:hypothetical protein